MHLSFFPHSGSPHTKPITICLLGLFLALISSSSTFGAFGLTTAADSYAVDTGAGLVFKIRRTDAGSSTQSPGDIMSLIYNGVEYQDQSRGSQINSGFDWLGYPTANVSVNAEVVNTDFIKITVTTDYLTHYYMARKGYPHIYMATYFTVEPVTGGPLCRYILRIQRANLTNGPAASDLLGTDGAIESGDIFGFSSTNANTALIGQSRSKHYSGIRLKDWAYIGANNSATNPTAGMWMVRDNQEGSSGGPFFKSLLNQGTTTNQEITYIVNYGEGQTETFYRMSILNCYTLVMTNGTPPGVVDTSWFSGMGLTGYVAPSGRGSVTCSSITGRDTTYAYTVGFSNGTAQYPNGTAQYFTAASAADGSFTMAGMLPGTYTMQVYKNELSVYTNTAVTVSAGGTTTLAPIAIAAMSTSDLTTGDPSRTVPMWRIGNWDGTPNEFLYADKITYMHPSDVRITGTSGTAAWAPGPYIIGASSSATGMPCYQWKTDVNGSQAVQFNLASAPSGTSTVRIGITCAFAGGRPNISVNNWSNASLPTASTQPDSRTLTVGTYRGNNKIYTFTVPAGTLVAGSNTLSINVISGSSGATYLSPGYSLDCIDIYNGTAQTLALPAALTGLTATAGDTQVVLNWSAVSGATAYRVQRSTASGGPYTTISSTATGTSFTDTGLTNGTTYYYAVSAINGSGAGVASAEVNATPSVIPTPPTNLVAMPYQRRAVLTWTVSTLATSYKVKRSLTSGSGFSTVQAGVTGTTFTDSGLTNGTTYYYVVSAVNSLGESADSAEVSVVPSSSVTFSFSSVAAEDGYIRGASGNLTGSTINSNSLAIQIGDYRGTPGRQYKGIFSFDTSLIPDGATVASATLKMKRQGLSNTNPFTIFGTCYVDIKGGTGFNGNPALEAGDFQASADATQVATMSNAANNGDWSTGSLNATGARLISTIGTTQFRVYFSTLTNNDTVDDYISWYSGDNTSASANRPVLEVTYTRPDTAPPTAPSGLTATPGNASVALSWTASAETDTYTVLRSTNGSGYVAVGSALIGTTFTDTNLTNGSVYYYVVTATNGAGTSANSTQASATPIAPLSAPDGLSSTAGNAQITLSWNATPTATSYNIKRSLTSGSGFTAIATSNTTTVVDASVTNGTTYYYVVSAVNGSGESPDSAQAIMRPTAPVSAQEQQASSMAMSDGHAALTMNASVVGHSYQLQYRDDLTTGAWLDSGSSIPGNGGVIQFTAPMDSSVPRRFYRIFIQP
jgi:rhamnogalacturonan endolyase